jgi:hypothetical protein
MTWSFDVEPDGLVRPDPGSDRPGLKEALHDGVESLSPVGTAPALSTYWIDQAIAGVQDPASSGSVVSSGDAWSLVRDGDTVIVRFDYAAEGEEPTETIPVEELAAGLTDYRNAVLQALDGGHTLDDRWWAQRNPR